MVLLYSRTVSRRRAYGPAESTTPSVRGGGGWVVSSAPPPAAPVLPVTFSPVGEEPPPGCLPPPFSPVQASVASDSAASASPGTLLVGIIEKSPAAIRIMCRHPIGRLPQ